MPSIKFSRVSEAELFSFFRMIFGLYLLCHFLYLIPYGGELFSSEGVLPSASSNLTYGYFPNILYRFDSPNFISFLLVGLSALAVLFLLGIQRRWTSLLLWYGWVCLYHRNNLIHNPSIPYMSWLLLACSLIPAGEPRFPYPPSRSSENWKMPKLIYIGAWILLGLGYSLSGFDKLWNSPSWRNGDAVPLILTNPLARDWFLNRAIQSLPPAILHLMTYSTVLTELLFGPLALWSKTRIYAWLAMLGVQIGILLTVNFADLTLGMLIIQLFVFDPRWLQLRKS